MGSRMLLVPLFTILIALPIVAEPSPEGHGSTVACVDSKGSSASYDISLQSSVKRTESGWSYEYLLRRLPNRSKIC